LAQFGKTGFGQCISDDARPAMRHLLLFRLRRIIKTMNASTSVPALRGGLLALLAAGLFGLSTPLVQRFGQGLGAFTTAALLYAGAALVALAMRYPKEREAALRRCDLPRMLAMAGFGAVMGPVALAWGLQRTSGPSASLMLTLEALFTALLAWRLYGETMDRRVAAAMVFLLAGGMALVLEQGLAGNAQLLGLLAVLAATAAWGVDNTLSRGVAERDPGQVVLVKSCLGATATAILALLAGEPMPGATAGAALLAVGATGYGLSLRLYLLAQREFGAGRTGSVFAFAPFIGVLGALAFGDRSATWMMVVGGVLMLAGVLLHLAESHGHAHEHGALEHEHAHTHDDGHHLHAHDGMPRGKHSHWHRHAPTRHTHPHVPDAHHLHPH
jgi:drug/metabolite transporter (DMT)-like permease